MTAPFSSKQACQSPCLQERASRRAQLFQPHSTAFAPAQSRFYPSSVLLARSNGRFLTESCIIHREFFAHCNITQRIKCVIFVTTNIRLLVCLWLVKEPSCGHQAEISRTTVSFSVVFYDAKIFIQTPNFPSHSFDLALFHPHDWRVVIRENGCSFWDCTN